tara:strand:- start:186 stop:377 length:192 start_codon:yes stop_codon:yes gene_type:complete
MKMKEYNTFNTGIDRLSKLAEYLLALGVDTSQMKFDDSVSLLVEVEKVLELNGIKFEKNDISN